MGSHSGFALRAPRNDNHEETDIPTRGTNAASVSGGGVFLMPAPPFIFPATAKFVYQWRNNEHSKSSEQGENNA
ncbi:hypothetical protein [Bradyrhizobium sp. CCGUVB23]|uniref:hypothetical protein n=1 Tax=Bradyrhizobium sp. CCGUVB23 TaxID=2949630 RepID=UPI0020B461ED|nr:hypothetical protein [Bradyrhizobium sp. CCGUVB23]MCP3463991.1 hypothetical protein [Bradyrhizobium sp. CCGUVB23]